MYILNREVGLDANLVLECFGQKESWDHIGSFMLSPEDGMKTKDRFVDYIPIDPMGWVYADEPQLDLDIKRFVYYDIAKTH